MANCMRSAKSLTTRPSRADFAGASRARCESLFTRRGTRQTIAEKYSARHFLRIQQSLEPAELGNANWNPADCLAEVEGEMVPILRLLEPGAFGPGMFRPQRCILSKEGEG